MRFLMIVSGYPPAKKAGMESGCKRLAEALVNRGHSVIVLTINSKDLPEFREENGVQVYRAIKPLAIGPLWGITYMRDVARWMRKLADQWDFCVCHQLYLHSVVAREICQEYGRVYTNLLVVSGAMSEIQHLRTRKFGERLLRRALDAHGFFCLSESVRRELLDAGVLAEKLHDFRYLVDTDAFFPEGEPTTREFLYLGRFHEQKNLPLLIRAFTIASEQHPELTLRIIGKGPAEGDLHAAIGSSPAKDRIRIEAWTDDPISAYRRAWVNVTASNAEGLSNVLLESLACGTPVITTDVSGAREALDPEGVAPSPIPGGEIFVGEGGMITPIGDAVALAAAISRLSTPPCREELSTKARRRAIEGFSEGVVAEHFLSRANAIKACVFAPPEKKDREHENGG